MSCTSCGKSNFTSVRMVCRVCELVNDDLSPKGVAWCDICSAYICEKHWTDGFERLKAAGLNVYESLKRRAEKIIR